MGKVSYKKGTILHHNYDMVGSMEIVLSGVVKMSGSHFSANITAGGIIGALESPNTLYSYVYEVMEDAVLFDYTYYRPTDLEKVIASNGKLSANIAGATIRTYMEICRQNQAQQKEAADLYRFIQDSYAGYKDLCVRFKCPSQSLTSIDELSEYAPDEGTPGWEIPYFHALLSLDPAVRQSLYAVPHIGTGLIMQCIERTIRMTGQLRAAADYLTDLYSYVISEDSQDFFDLYSNLVFNASQNPFADTTPIEAAVSKLIIYLQNCEYLDSYLMNRRVEEYRRRLQDLEDQLLSEDHDLPLEKEACDDLDHSLETILTFAGTDPEAAEEFRNLLDSYKLLPDRNDTSDAARNIRRSISFLFYKIYYAAFLKSLQVKNIPVPVKMFFNFGYMDEELCGLNNAVTLYDITKSLKPDPSGTVVTMYEWLMRIYEGKEEPSHNEFDLDYPAYLKERKSSGAITAQQEATLLADRREKVRFEIENMFTSGNRMTFGRVTTFVPVLSDHNIIRSLESTLLTPERIRKELDEIRRVDYSCFRRSIMYTNKACGVQKEYIDVEVLPHVILMPNIGARGALWQETADSRRDTPGRMMLSIFHTENLSDIMLRLAGEFRWELCKKIQGVHWNDVTDPSLTSEYSDYIQFYRKNHDLSTDAKEKVKAQLQKAKNNYRDFFVLDYVQWVKYEASGSPRMNRISRAIMSRYCPFSSDIRSTLSVNPLYQELFERHKTKMSQARHLLDVQIQKITKAGMNVPKELTAQMDYLNL